MKPLNSISLARTRARCSPHLWRPAVVALAMSTVFGGLAQAQNRADPGALAQERANLRALAQERANPRKLSIETLSTKPHLVTGGNVLVRINVPRGTPLGQVKIEVNRSDISSRFVANGPAHTLTGLVGSLLEGDNQLEVSTGRGNGSTTERLKLTNYPITGPVLSGPHMTPYICQTEQFLLPDGTALGAPIDADCSVTTRFHYVYKATTGTTFIPLPTTTSVPPDAAQTTTSTGETVNFIVRVETGTINRGIYQILILHDPTRDAAITPFTPPRGWNKRVHAQQGSGCPGGWYRQGAALGGNVFDVGRLGLGFAMYANTLNHPSNSCNSLVAGESNVMTKERFIEGYGVPLSTISTGGSGGAYTSLQVADAFPGLFDGIAVSSTFPDALSIALSGLDGHLLTHYFTATNPAGFTEAQQVAVSGYHSLRAFTDAANQSQRTDPVPGRVDIPGYSPAVWNAVVPVELRYHPVTNRTGARPTVFDVARNVYGVDPATGFALRPFDNVGVQYGLEAVNSGAITVEQFLDLNTRIGGYDQDANYVPQRSVGDTGAIRRAHQGGLQLSGGGGLGTIPVMDYGGVNDASGYHYQWFHFAVRERMLQENGATENHVMWRGTGPSPIPVLDRWVAAWKADASNDPDWLKVLKHKPTDAVDGCYTAGADPQFIAEPQFLSREPNSRCNTIWPAYEFPRKVAGGPLAANTLQCRLQAPKPDDYKVVFSQQDWARLESDFPNGVCDWSKRGTSYRSVVEWPSFGPSRENLVYDITKR